jgi:hypothetical protein
VATNEFLIGISVQSGEDTPATAPQYRFFVTGADLRPQVATATREETNLTRDSGDTLVTERSVGGGFTAILRDMTAPLLYYGVMGAKAAALRGAAWSIRTFAVGDLVRPTDTANKNLFEVTVGGTPPTGAVEPVWPPNVGDTVTADGVTYVNRGRVQRAHTVTPAPDQPWLTLWRFWSRSIAERFGSCKLVSHQTTGGADQNNGDIVGQFGVVGKSYEYLSSLAFDPYDPADATAGTLDNSQPIRWPGRVMKLDGTADDDVDQINHQVNADQNAARTGKLTYSRIEPGRRTSTFTGQRIYRNADDYRRAAYGSPTATTPVDEVAVRAFNLALKDASGVERFVVDVPRVGYTEDPNLPINPNGEIARIGFGGGVQRPAAGGVLSYVFHNNVSAY